MRWVALAAVVALATRAQADTLGISSRIQLIATAQDEAILGGLAMYGHTFAERWQIGADLGATVGNGGAHVFTIAAVEAGMWVHPSPRLDLLFGWRAGFSYIHLQYGVHLDALLVEPVVALTYRVGASARLRFEPIVASAYRSGPWQAAIGTQLGVEWSL